MIRCAKLVFFPLVAAVLIAAGWVWGRHSFRLFYDGGMAYGTISAVLKYYDAHADLIVALDQEVIITRASGVRVEARMRNGQITAVTIVSNGQATAVALAGDAPRALEGAVREVCVADAGGVKRFLMRHGAPAAADRLQSIVRTETAKVIPGVHGAVRAITASNGVVLALVTDGGTFAASAAHPVVTTMSFTLQTNGTSYARTVNGAAVPPPAFKDFFLFERDYRYSFRPVFSFAISGAWYTVLADVGRRMTPPGAYPPFAPVCIAYDPHHPADAQLVPDFVSIRKMTFLQRFNATIEAVFIRWLYPFLFFSVGSVMALVALLIISLELAPGPRHPGVSPAEPA